MNIIKKTFAALISLLIAFPPALMAETMGSALTTSAGDIAVDGTTQTGVDRAQNGVPVVNIAPPSGAGVSHNRYSDFNVGNEGAIMNNSNRMEVSQLGGALYGNPNLDPNKEAARVILNEVTSTRASRLLGATEIHGRAADYILANPNGITCNGCEFINTPRVLLGTGRPVMDNGDFIGMNMDASGQFVVEGLGLNAGSADYFDIVTRMAKINAEVHANQLTLKTGNGFYDDRTRQMDSAKTASQNAPALSIDSSLLGGIYAGRITLESTELGVGVNTSGSVLSQEDMVFTADGRIDYANAASEKGGISMESKNSGIQQNSFSAAKGDISLTAKNKIVLNGDESRGKIGVNSTGSIRVNSRGSVGSGIENNTGLMSSGKITLETDGDATTLGSLISDNEVNIDAQNVSMENGEVNAARDINISASKDVALTRGEVVTFKNLNIAAKGDISNGASVLAKQKAVIKTDKHFSNDGDLISGSQQNAASSNVGLEIEADSIENGANGSLVSYGNTDIRAGNDIFLNGGAVFVNGDLNLQNQGTLFNNAEIEAGNNAVFNADAFVNGTYGNIYAAGSADLSVKKDFINDGSLTAGDVSQPGNSSGIRITAENILNGANGQMFSYGNADLDVKNDVTLAGGETVAYGDLTVKAGGSFANSSDVQAGNQADFSVKKDFKNEGALLAGSANQNNSNVKISIHSETLENSGSGKILSYGNLEAAVSKDILLSGAQVAANGDINISGNGSLDNQTEVQAGGALTASVNKAMSNSGTFLADSIDLSADSFSNSNSGQVLSYGDASIQTSRDAVLTGGSLIAMNNLTLKAQGGIINNAGMHAENKLTLSAQKDIANFKTLTGGSAINSGNPATGIEIKSDSFSNDPSGTVFSYGNLGVAVNKDLNLTGHLDSIGNMDLDSKGSIANNTDIQSDGKVSLTAVSNISNNGKITGGSVGNPATGIILKSNGLGNGGKLLSYGNSQILVNQDLDLTGQIMTYGDLIITGSNNITNKTTLDTSGKTFITAGRDFSNGYLVGADSVLHKLLSNSDVSILAQNSIFNYGSIETGGNLTLTAKNKFINDRRVSNQGLQGNALITSMGSTAVYADRITNSAGEILAHGDITLQKDASGGQSSSVDNLSDTIGGNDMSAVIESDQDIRIRSKLLNNLGKDSGSYGVGMIQVGPPGEEYESLVAEERIVWNNMKTMPSYISAGRDMSIDGADIVNHGSVLSAGRDLTITGGSVKNEMFSLNAGPLLQIFQNHHQWKDCNIWGGNCTSHEIIYERTNTYGPTADSNFAPILFAGNNLLINNVKNVNNGNAGTRFAKSVNSAVLDAVKQTGMIPTAGISVPSFQITDTIQQGAPQSFGSGISASVIALNSKTVQPATVPDVSLLNLSALFGLSENLQSRFLIESRSQFTSVGSLKGSQYFLDRIGYNPHTDVKLLGDEYYQAKLIERSIREATGKVYLNNKVSGSLEQLAMLYSNAYDEAVDWNLTPGIALSSDQINKLKKDIVWLVETEVVLNGKPQKVLVPQVYLAMATRQALENPVATIEGKTVSIQSIGDVVNTGKMSAEDNLSVASDNDINNLEGRLNSNGNMALLAGHDILNKGGKVFAANDLLMDAKGSITNSNVKGRFGIASNWKDKITAAGDIKAGNSAALLAGKDINILGAGLRAENNLALAAEGNVNIAADRLDSHFESHNQTHGETYDHVEDSTRHFMANVNSGGDMQISSGKNIAIAGGNVGADGSMSLDAKDDITIASVQDRDYSFTRTTSKDLTSSEENVNASASVRQNSSNLSAGGDFSSNSGRDTNVIASNVSAAGNGTLVAGRDMNVLSDTDSDSNYSYHKETHMDAGAVALGAVVGSIVGGPSGMVAGAMTGAKAESGEIKKDSIYDTREVASNLNFGGNLTAISGGDANIVSSKLNSAASMRVLAGSALNDDGSIIKVNDHADINIGAKQNIHEEHHSVEELKPDYAGVAMGSAISGLVAGASAGLGGFVMAGAGGAVLGASAGVVAGAVGSGVSGLAMADVMSDTVKVMVNKQEKNTLDIHQTKLASSEISSGENIGLSASHDILVSASNLKSAGDISLEAGNDVTIASAEERLNQKETHSELSFDDFNVKVNRSSVDTNWSQKGLEREKETDRTTQKQSEVAAGGNISVKSGKDTNIVSSNLMAGEKVSLNAGKDVNLLAAKETETVTERESSFKNTFTQTVGNSWVEAGYAAYDAATQLADTAKADNAGSKEGKINTAITAAKAAIAVYQVAKIAQAAAGSAATAGTFGFNASLSMTQEKETKSSSQEKSAEVGSAILSNNIDITANNDLSARGTTLIADGGDIHLKAGDDVKIESSENSVGTRFAQEKLTLKTILASTNGDFIPTMSVSRSEGASSQVTQNNAQISANGGTVKIESGSDTDLLGVNLKAKNVDMTHVGGDLTLASKQDRSESESNSYSLTLGRQNVGFSISQSKTSENWTNSQSSVIGTDGVAIKADELNMVGSVIANQKSDGTDGGNLNVAVNKLNVKDLKDTSTSENFSFSIGVSAAGSEDKKGNDSTSWKGGGTNIAVGTSGHDKEGMTHTTLGQGNITVAENPDSLASVNRDINNSQVVTKDEKTGGLNFDVSVSNRLIVATATGDTEDLKAQVEEVFGTLKNLPGNVVKAGERVGKASEDVAETAMLAIKGKTDGISGTLDQYKLRVADNEAYARMTPKQREIMKNPGKYSVKEKLETTNRYNQVFAAVLGIDPAEAHIFSAQLINEDQAIAKNGGGAPIDKRNLIAGTDANPENKDIYYENDRTNTEDNLPRAAGHEGARYLNIQKGNSNDSSHDGVSGPQDELARNMGQHSVNALDFESRLQDDNNDEVYSANRRISTDVDNKYVKAGSVKMNEVKSLEPDIAFHNDSSGAGGNGHMSLFFQDEKGTWYQYNQGSAESNGSNLKYLLNFGFKEGIGIEEKDPAIAQLLQMNKNNENIVYIKTSNSQDKKISEAAFDKLNTTGQRKYRLWTNNCVDSVQDVVKSGGIKLPLDINPKPNHYIALLKNKFK